MLDDDALREMLPRLRRFALWLIRDPACADDLVQATLEKALSRWAGKRAEGELRAWLFSILYRQFLDGQRRQRRQAALLALLGRQPEQQVPPPEQGLQAHATLAAFEKLPAEQRALLILVGVEGLSYAEAACTLQMPIGTVMSRLSRARQALRALEDGGAPGPRLRRQK